MPNDLNDPAYWNMLVRRSLTRFYLLAALARKPMYGYELARAITDLCDGCCDPSDAVIYPLLKELCENGLCNSESFMENGRRRNVCTLTQQGRDALRQAAAAWQQVLPSLQEAIAVAEEAGGSLTPLETGFVPLDQIG